MQQIELDIADVDNLGLILQRMIQCKQRFSVKPIAPAHCPWHLCCICVTVIVKLWTTKCCMTKHLGSPMVYCFWHCNLSPAQHDSNRSLAIDTCFVHLNHHAKVIGIPFHSSMSRAMVKGRCRSSRDSSLCHHQQL